VWLVTTNDNVRAKEWHVTRGFEVTEVRLGAVDASRRALKPSIPVLGEGGVPIRDEMSCR